MTRKMLVNRLKRMVVVQEKSSGRAMPGKGLLRIVWS
jgi:hypothetical protein